MLQPISRMMVGKKTGMEEKATLQEKNIAYFWLLALRSLKIIRRAYGCEVALWIFQCL